MRWDLLDICLAMVLYRLFDLPFTTVKTFFLQTKMMKTQTPCNNEVRWMLYLAPRNVEDPWRLGLRQWGSNIWDLQCIGYMTLRIQGWRITTMRNQDIEDPMLRAHNMEDPRCYESTSWILNVSKHQPCSVCILQFQVTWHMFKVSVKTIQPGWGSRAERAKLRISKYQVMPIPRNSRM